METSSMLQRVLGLKNSLPSVRRQIFELLYQQGQAPATCAGQLGLTPEQFETEHREMLRSLRLGAASA
jgi:hypothetical protein